MTATFVQNIKKFESTFNQTLNKLDVTIVNQNRTFTSTFSAIGQRGKSTYEIAIENGFVGTPEEFINQFPYNIDGGVIF